MDGILDSIRDPATRFLTEFTQSYEGTGMPEVETFVTHYIRGTCPGDITELAYFARKAIILAEHALSSAHTDFGNLAQYFYPGFKSSLITKIFHSETEHLPTISLFRRQQFMAAGVDLNMGQRYSGGREPLISSTVGRVIFPRPLLDHSTQQSGPMGLVVIPGRIHFGNACFESVIDVGYDGILYTPTTFGGQSVAIFDDTYERVVLKVPLAQSIYSPNYLFREDQRSLLMKVKLTGGDLFPMGVSYPDCLEQLAFAVHIGEPEIPQSMSVIAGDLRLGGLETINLVGCHKPQTRIERSSKEYEGCVTHIPNSQELRFFASHPSWNRQDFKLYILQGAEVVEGLHEISRRAKAKDGKWMLITGYDR